MHMQLPIATPQPIIFFGKLCRCNKVGPSHVDMWLPIVTPGPVNVLGTVIDDVGLAQ